MDNLRIVRRKNGESMKSLGEVVGVSESAISQYETGKRQPDFEILLKLSEHYNVTVDYLLGNENPASHSCDNPDDLTDYLDELHKRPEMKMLFSVAKKASKEDVEKAVKIIEMFKKDSED